MVNHTFCFPVVSQGGGPGAGSRPQLPLPAARDPADQERAPLAGHGLPLCAPCSSLGPDPSQRPQPSVQARIHTTTYMMISSKNHSLKLSVHDVLKVWYPKLENKHCILKNSVPLCLSRNSVSITLIKRYVYTEFLNVIFQHKQSSVYLHCIWLVDEIHNLRELEILK